LHAVALHAVQQNAGTFMLAHHVCLFYGYVMLESDEQYVKHIHAACIVAQYNV